MYYLNYVFMLNNSLFIIIKHYNNYLDYGYKQTGSRKICIFILISKYQVSLLSIHLASWQPVFFF